MSQDNFAKMQAQMASGDGFIAALDQSGGSTPKALALYGVEADAYSNDAEMFAAMQAMRARIMQATDFTSAKVIGAILFERTMNEAIGGTPVPDYLWNTKGVAPFLKVDKGLEDEANGVQMMKPMPGLEALLAQAKSKGVFGTKMRSVIQSADAAGIRAIVAQQFEVGQTISNAGLMPILEPEVNIHSETKAEAEAILKAEILGALDAMPGTGLVMIKLTIPSHAGLYADLAAHPRVLRVVALSGGYSTDEACNLLANNKGMIASFSRALTEGLNVAMSDDGFNQALGANIDKIYRASI